MIFINTITHTKLGLLGRWNADGKRNEGERNRNRAASERERNMKTMAKIEQEGGKKGEKKRLRQKKFGMRKS